MYKMYKCLKNKTGKGFYFKEKEKKKRTSQNFVGEGDRMI